MKISKQCRREARELFRSCLVDGVLDEARARQAARLVLERKPRGYLPLLSHFQRLLRLELERRTARIQTAGPLPPDQEAAVKASLTQAYGPGLDITFTQNPALIGGMRVRVGSDVCDGSIQARLAALAEGF